MYKIINILNTLASTYPPCPALALYPFTTKQQKITISGITLPRKIRFIISSLSDAFCSDNGLLFDSFLGPLSAPFGDLLSAI